MKSRKVFQEHDINKNNKVEDNWMWMFLKPPLCKYI